MFVLVEQVQVTQGLAGVADGVQRFLGHPLPQHAPVRVTHPAKASTGTLYPCGAHEKGHCDVHNLTSVFAFPVTGTLNDARR